MKKSLLILIILFLFGCSKKEINNNGIVFDFTLENFIENYDPDEIITNSILEELDKQQLRIIRNSIFAKHGYIFKSSDLQDYFSKISWYNGTKANVDNELTETDKLNIQNIISYENNPENKEAASLVSVDSLPVVTQYGNSYNDLNAITEYLKTINASQENPISLKLNISLGTMTDTDSNWRRLLKILDDAGKYVALDLSACPISGRDLNPISSVQTGKWFIVSLILPDVAKNIPSGTEWTSTFNFFENLKTLSAKEITTIGMNAFDACLSLSVSFPSITNIAENTFAGCTGLVSVNFPVVIDIGKGAFTGCIGLSRAIFPTATTIGEKAFQGCTSLTNMSFPKVVSIGREAFEGCTSLSNVIFPVTLTININAFKGCTRLAVISFPAATTICGGAFERCYNLSRISFPEVTTIEDSRPSSSTFAWAISYEGAFEGCTSLISISFPAATMIGRTSFQYCINLANVNFPVATGISESAFRGCISLVNVSFPALTGISKGAFADCTALASVNFPAVMFINADYDSRIGTGPAFAGCTSLTKVTLGENYRNNLMLTFPGDLYYKYHAGGAGTYTRSSGSDTWTKQ